MRSVEFYDWDGARHLQVHPDHVRIGAVAVPYGRIDSVAIERDHRGAGVDLVRLVISLGDDHLDLTLPVDDAERAKLLIQVPEARSQALVDRVFGPVDGPLLVPPVPEGESGSGVDSQPLLPISRPGQEGDLDGPLLAPWEAPAVAPLWLGATAEVPLPPVELDGQGAEDGHHPVDTLVPRRRRTWADILFASALALAAGAAVFLLSVSHRSPGSPLLQQEALHGRASAAPARSVSTPGPNPHPTLAAASGGHRAGKHQRAGRRNQQAPSPAPSTAVAPPPVPTPQPSPKPVPTTQPPAPPPPSVSHPPPPPPPPPSPTISIG